MKNPETIPVWEEDCLDINFLLDKKFKEGLTKEEEAELDNLMKLNKMR